MQLAPSVGSLARTASSAAEFKYAFAGIDGADCPLAA
jgi:hypothetical protein